MRFAHCFTMDEDEQHEQQQKIPAREKAPILQNVDNLDEHLIQRNGVWMPLDVDECSDDELLDVIVDLGDKTCPKKVFFEKQGEKSNQRFATVTEDDLGDITSALHKKATKAQSKWAVDIYQGSYLFVSARTNNTFQCKFTSECSYLLVIAFLACVCSFSYHFHTRKGPQMLVFARHPSIFNILPQQNGL